MVDDWTCNCLETWHRNRFFDRFEPSPWPNLRIHDQTQDQGCEAWKRLSDLIEKAAADGREVFAPRLELGYELWKSIVELPRSIGKLKAVKMLDLFTGLPGTGTGSGIVRIPPEIGEMESLEKLRVYTSYRLHFLPYEVTRCTKIRKTLISIRALYGNHKNRFNFPRLPDRNVPEVVPANCSVCRGPFEKCWPSQRWISLRLDGNDVIPLLVHACSEDCIRRLPEPAEGYVDSPHLGGNDLTQPSAQFS